MLGISFQCYRYYKQICTSQFIRNINRSIYLPAFLISSNLKQEILKELPYIKTASVVDNKYITVYITYSVMIYISIFCLNSVMVFSGIFYVCELDVRNSYFINLLQFPVYWIGWKSFNIYHFQHFRAFPIGKIYFALITAK